MGGEGKHPPPLDEVEVPSPAAFELMLELNWTKEDLIQRRLEEVALHFLRTPMGQVDYGLVVVAKAMGSMTDNVVGHLFQQNLAHWIRDHATPSGIHNAEAFFLSVSGVPVRLRVDVSRGDISPILTFRAISR